MYVKTSVSRRLLLHLLRSLVHRLYLTFLWARDTRWLQKRQRMSLAENIGATAKPFNPEVQKKCIGDVQHDYTAVRQIFLTTSWISLKERWLSIKSRMRTFCPMHCSHRLQLISSNIVRLRRQRSMRPLPIQRTGHIRYNNIQQKTHTELSVCVFLKGI